MKACLSLMFSDWPFARELGRETDQSNSSWSTLFAVLGCLKLGFAALKQIVGIYGISKLNNKYKNILINANRKFSQKNITHDDLQHLLNIETKECKGLLKLRVFCLCLNLNRKDSLY